MLESSGIIIWHVEEREIRPSFMNTGGYYGTRIQLFSYFSAQVLTLSRVFVQESCELMKDTILTDLQMSEEQRMYKELLKIIVSFP